MENSEQDTPGKNLKEIQRHLATMSVKNYERKIQIKDINTNTDTIKNMNNSQYLDCGGGEI